MTPKCTLCGGMTGGVGFVVNEVEIRHRYGDNFPDDGAGEEMTFDLCGKCFQDKLVPWLESQGATPRVEEWDH